MSDESPLYPCLTNFKDQFAIFILDGCPFRYSFAQDKWEKLPPLEGSEEHPVAACSLGDKVYVLPNARRPAIQQISGPTKLNEKRTIRVLHNPGASFSSQDPPHWQVVFVPTHIMSVRLYVAFVPLNSTEIAILGGVDGDLRNFGDVLTFNTITNEFNKREGEEGALSFISHGN